MWSGTSPHRAFLLAALVAVALGAPSAEGKLMTPDHAKAYANRVIVPPLNREAEKYALTVYQKAKHCWNTGGLSFCRMGYKGTLMVGDTAWCSTIVSIRWHHRRFEWSQHDSVCWCAGQEPVRYIPGASLGAELRSLTARVVAATG